MSVANRPAHEVRRAAPGDAPRLAWVHVRAWQQAYAGLIPADYLDGLMSELPQRTAAWQEWVVSSPTWVAESAGEVVGFVVWRPSPDDDATPGLTAELGALYVLAEHWDRGAGRRLMAAALESMRAEGFQEATLWVLDSNTRARRFYEVGGWAADGATKVDQREGFAVREVRYRTRLVQPPGPASL